MKLKDVYKELANESFEIIGCYLRYISTYFSNGISDSEKGTIDREYSKYDGSTFPIKYQSWYTRSLLVLNVIANERKQDFIKQYEPDSKRKALTALNYTIYDTLKGVFPSSSSPLVSFNNLKIQVSIINSLKVIIDDRIYNLKSLIESEVFESELDTARYLLSKGFKRSAGAICGVLLERHLDSMCKSAGVTINKKDPTINDFNVELYKNGAIDSTQNKFLLYLSDLRNKCDHNKQYEPSDQEVGDLINGTKKVILTY